ncbi:hypothetical protein N7541_010708 [Penicillium brevicompactum]|uniref:Uncharacterized protein n=1 Tax=Penicillium brevicompactum TaxID=5074 RepID=A0A9W9QLH7_PENBR|nr:hypothetical protein N7452_005472 [Penicillium brevicompactum]KAJ5341584.1 hypothetical protein N7541_010708 [Penicillium brevicompactum]
MARELLIMGRTRNLRDVESNQEKSSFWRDWAFVMLWGIVGYTCIILTVLTFFNPGLIPFDISSLLFRKEISPFFAFSQSSTHYSKPQGFKIVALVPFHHHDRTAILDCYLQKNLAQHNGFLDQVVFVPQTEDAVGIDWLYSIVNQTPEYTIAPVGRAIEWQLAEENVMYIRIDGDTVFLEDNTIPTIVKTKLDNPSSLMVSANVVNEAALASLHSHPGVALPYLPELYHVEQPSRSKSQIQDDWRPSSLPRWQGPPNFRVTKDFKPPFQGHRWLLPRGASSDRDPIATSVYTDIGPTLDDWTVGAQQHYSFLHHLEENDLGHYKFPIWVDPTEPISPDFGCFWGNDAVAVRHTFNHKARNSSSHGSGGNRPHVIIDGKGVAAHYSARQGVAGLDATDLISRYREYALENVCRETE